MVTIRHIRGGEEEGSLKPSRLIYKDPFQADVIVLKNGGSIQTQGGTNIVAVNSSGSTVTLTGTETVVASEVVLAEGNMLVGNSSGVGVALNAKTSGQILVGNGTTVTSVAVSGDATITSAGVVTVVGSTGAFNVATNQTFTKEVNHIVGVTASTTAATAGGNLSFGAGQGATTGNGGAISVTGGISGTGATGNGGNATVAGGQAASTNGNGGSVIVQGGALSGTGVNGVVLIRSTYLQKFTVTNMTTSATMTVGAVLGGQILANQGAAGAASYQMPTAADIDAALPSDVAAGDAFEFTITNISTNAAEDVTVTTNTGITLAGNPVVASNAAATDWSVGTFRVVKTGAAAYTVCRVS